MGFRNYLWDFVTTYNCTDNPIYEQGNPFKALNLVEKRRDKNKEHPSTQTSSGHRVLAQPLIFLCGIVCYLGSMVFRVLGFRD